MALRERNETPSLNCELNSKFANDFPRDSYKISNRQNPQYFKIPNYKIPNDKIPNDKIPNYKIPNYKIPNYKIPKNFTVLVLQSREDIRGQKTVMPPCGNPNFCHVFIFLF